MGVIKPKREQETRYFGVIEDRTTAVRKLQHLVRYVSETRSLLEGIERLVPLFEQLGVIECLLNEIGKEAKKCGFPNFHFIPAFFKKMHKKYAPDLLEELETLSYALPEHEEQMEDLLGPLSLLDDGFVNASDLFSGREPGVVDSLLDDDPSEGMTESGNEAAKVFCNSSRRLRKEIQLISSRLVEQIRAEGLTLHGALIAVYGESPAA
jgi:hypothetical protein